MTNVMLTEDEHVNLIKARIERDVLRSAIIAYVVEQGPCEDADDDAYCGDDDCLYCKLAFSVDECNRKDWCNG